MFDVPKLSIFSEFVTLAISKLLKSRLVKPEQLENIDLMYVTFDVLKLLKLRLVKLEQL